MSNSKKEKTPSQKNSKTEKLFSTALLLNLSQFQNSIPDSELENQQRLNNSSSAIQGDSILNDLLSEDLINKIDQLSPIRSNNPPKKKMSDICLILILLQVIFKLKMKIKLLFKEIKII